MAALGNAASSASTVITPTTSDDFTPSDNLFASAAASIGRFDDRKPLRTLFRMGRFPLLPAILDSSLKL